MNPTLLAEAGGPTLAMSFRAPHWLWALVAVAAMAVAYGASQARRGQYAVRLTNPALLDKVAPRRPEWRRHVPAATYLLALAGLVLAMARPTHEVQIARGNVMLAMDVSRSMVATDVEPSRIEAAQSAALSFADRAPASLRVGLVIFNERARVVVPATTDRDALRRALERLDLELSGGTAIGEAIAASAEALQLAADQTMRGLEDPSGALDPPGGGGFGESTDDGGNPTGRAPSAADAAPGKIVLLSDGTNTMGRDPVVMARAAADEGIEVTTIAFGTDGGVVTVDGQRVRVPADARTLRQVAETTGGQFFDADTASELAQVYQRLSGTIGKVPEEREIAVWFAGAGLVLLLAGGGLSLRWFARLP